MSQQVRLEDHVYERSKAAKRDDESFSDAVERLIGGRSLRDLRDVFEKVRWLRCGTLSRLPSKRSVPSRSASSDR